MWRSSFDDRDEDDSRWRQDGSTLDSRWRDHKKWRQDIDSRSESEICRQQWSTWIVEELQQRVARSECLYNSAIWRLEALEFLLLNGRNHVQAVSAKEEIEHERPSMKHCAAVAANIVETWTRERQRDDGKEDKRKLSSELEQKALAEESRAEEARA